MSSVPMPRDLSEEAVAEWLGCVYAEAGMYVGPRGAEGRFAMARAVRSLVEQKVREAVEATKMTAISWDEVDFDDTDAIVARVLGGA